MPVARKRFGQNFLVDIPRLELVVNTINPEVEDFLIEIGAGTGALTRMLLPSGADITSLEIDRDLIAGLKVEFFQSKNFKLIEADALRYDFSELLEEAKSKGKKIRLVGNLPYNIATKLIFNFWQLAGIEEMYFMLQEEVALRLTAGIGDKNYGRLSILSEYYCEAEIIMDFPPESFSPSPKVNSSFIRLVPRSAGEVDLGVAQELAKTLRICFAQRRKTIGNNLREHISAEALQGIGIDARLRPQNLTLDDYLKISKEMSGSQEA